MKKTLVTMVVIMVVAILMGTFNTAKYVTAGETNRDGRFIAYDNGTVLDTITNLMWAAKDNGGDTHWGGAKSYCDDYRGGGYTDWRMPTQDELAGLYDAAKTYSSDRGPKVHLTELIHLSRDCVWAVERRGDIAAIFGFGDGRRDWYIYFNNSRSPRALPVRSGN